ncbi:hypothetical protein JCM11251_002078 [Rhodosporidiobolus azoricus]
MAKKSSRRPKAAPAAKEPARTTISTTSPPLPRPHPRPTMTFSLLPSDLKRQIALEARRNDRFDRLLHSDDAQGGGDEEYNSLGSLAQVDRELWSICRPLIWEHVNLKDRSMESLVVFIVDILPTCANLVLSLEWDLDTIFSMTWGLLEPPAGRFAPGERDVVRWVEDLCRFNHQPPIWKRRTRAPALFVNAIVRRCPSLVKVDFVLFPRNRAFGIFKREVNSWRDYAFGAVLSVASQVKEAKITLEYDDRAARDELPKLFQRARNLESVSLEDIAPSLLVPPSGNELHRKCMLALASLPKFRSFTAHVFPSNPLSHPSILSVLPPLTHLCLRYSGPGAVQDFAALLKAVSPSLESLECGNVKTVDSTGMCECCADRQKNVQPYDEPFLLPRLSHLSFYETSHASILPLFRNCPISVLTVYGMSMQTRDDALTFIRQLAVSPSSPLKKVEVLTEDSDELWLPNRGKGEVKAVKQLCRKVGVVCEEIWADSGSMKRDFGGRSSEGESEEWEDEDDIDAEVDQLVAYVFLM